MWTHSFSFIITSNCLEFFKLYYSLLCLRQRYTLHKINEIIFTWFFLLNTSVPKGGLIAIPKEAYYQQYVWDNLLSDHITSMGCWKIITILKYVYIIYYSQMYLLTERMLSLHERAFTNRYCCIEKNGFTQFSCFRSSSSSSSSTSSSHPPRSHSTPSGNIWVGCFWNLFLVKQ